MNDNEAAVCFQFICEFEDASARERPKLLAEWRRRFPEHASMLWRLARDVLRDERMVTRSR